MFAALGLEPASGAAGGTWMEKILHNFNYNDKDGLQP
jgi:hypothetical protein